MAISLDDLPDKYKAQAIKKWQEQQSRKRGRAPESVHTSRPSTSKYHAQPVDTGVIRFDSKKEFRRFEELSLMEQAGTIRDLRLQADFTLQEAYTATNGERTRAIRYRADFTYYKVTASGEIYVVEDVKSKPTRTKEYAMKKKMLKDRFGIDIAEV